MKIYKNVFNKIISLENLFSAWDKFKSGKQKKRDVQFFEWRLEQNIFQLHRDLKDKKYEHSAYSFFYIRDPKQRHIHKATVRDRILHHAVFIILNPIFESTFIPNSFSCRIDKGTHKGIDILEKLTRQISNNAFKPCFVLKCDIRKFFETIDHKILLNIIRKRIKDSNTMRLLEEIVESYPKGLPLGNLTSQLFANIYLNESDQFIKHNLKVKNYIRYTDDFVIVARNKPYLENLIAPIRTFLSDKLALELHPNKITIRKFHQGIDFLGYVVLPRYKLLRTKTKRRIFKKLKEKIKKCKEGKITEQTIEQSLQSYLGVLSHANAYKLSDELKNQFWFWLNE